MSGCYLQDSRDFCKEKRPYQPRKKTVSEVTIISGFLFLFPGLEDYYGNNAAMRCKEMVDLLTFPGLMDQASRTVGHVSRTDLKDSWILLLSWPFERP